MFQENLQTVARPSTRRPRQDRPPPAQPPRPRVRDFSRSGGDYAVEWDVRPAYDFVISLSHDAGATEDLPAQDRRWLAEAKAALDPSVRDDMKRLFATEECINIAGFLVDRPSVVTARDFLSALESEPHPNVLRCLFSDPHWQDEDKAAPLEAALAGDTAALAELAKSSAGDPHRARRVALLTDPDELVAGMLRVMRAWIEPFSSIEPRVAAMLKRDVEDRAGDRATLDSVDL